MRTRSGCWWDGTWKRRRRTRRAWFLSGVHYNYLPKREVLQVWACRRWPQNSDGWRADCHNKKWVSGRMLIRHKPLVLPQAGYPWPPKGRRGVKVDNFSWWWFWMNRKRSSVRLVSQGGGVGKLVPVNNYQLLIAVHIHLFMNRWCFCIGNLTLSISVACRRRWIRTQN